MLLFPEGSEENPDLMIEAPRISGPVPFMIRETLSYLKTNIIKQRITKPADSEISDKVFNYPYQSFEEAVVNALYYRNYQEREPVEITIEPDKVEILSHSGPDRSISDKMIQEAKRLKTRKYRNRRLGDFLKELGLSEGHATGIPTIQKHLSANGSRAATIGTDDNRSYFLMTIPCRDDFAGDMSVGKSDINFELPKELVHILGQSFVQVNDAVSQCIMSDKAQLGQLLGQLFTQVWKRTRDKGMIPKLLVATIDLLCLLKETNMTANAIAQSLDIGNTKDLKRKILFPLIDRKYISMTAPDKPTSAKQAYKLTTKGESLFNLEKS